MATKSPETTIDFLLTCLECTEGKTNWEEVAVKTGWYKSGKFSRQAFVGIQKKYGGKEVGSNNESAGGGDGAKDPTTPKKRTADDKGGASGSSKKLKQSAVGGDVTPVRDH